MKLRLPSEWSKLLTVLVLIPFLCSILLTAYIALRLLWSGQASSCVEIIQALLIFVAAPVAVAYGFYFWKAKCENSVKYAKELKKAGVEDGVAQEAINE